MTAEEKHRDEIRKQRNRQSAEKSRKKRIKREKELEKVSERSISSFLTLHG